MRIQAADFRDLPIIFGLIFYFWIEPVFAAVRLEIRLIQKPLDLPGGNSGSYTLD